MQQPNIELSNVQQMVPKATQQSIVSEKLELKAHLGVHEKSDKPHKFVTDENSDYLIIAFGTLQVSILSKNLLNGECLLIMADTYHDKVVVSGNFMMIKICGSSTPMPFGSPDEQQSQKCVLRQKSPCLYLLAHSAKRHIALNSLDVDEYARALAIVGRAEFASQYETQGSDPSSELPNWKMRLVDSYILDNIESTLPLDELASKCQMSPGYFCRLFKSRTGATPHQYILSKRVEKACDMLKNPSPSICEVAYSSGFSSQSHMTAIFKKTIGFTPKSYRAEQSMLPAMSAAN